MKPILSLFTLFILSTAAFAQEEKPAEVFVMVEVQPEYPGGMVEFYKYIMKNMRYPDYARKNSIEGRVHVQFEIDTTGAIVKESVVVHRGVHESLDQEAVRLLQECPDWKPGRHTRGGAPAKVRMIVPITFRLDSKAAKKKKGA